MPYIKDKNLKESKSEISMKVETMNSTKELKMGNDENKQTRSRKSSNITINENDYMEIKNNK